MADNTINVRLKDRIDTESNWTSKNPILLKGERGLIEGTAKYKIGDGTTKWSDLPLYQGMTSSDRSKLDGIASGANKTTIDSAMSTTSTNPVQNKVVKSALDSQNNELKKLIDEKLPANFDTVNQNVSFNGSVHAEDLTAGNIIVTGAARFNSGMYGDVHGNATSADSVDWSGVKNKPSTYSPSAHNHDDRYYTEAETDKKLDTKSNTGHTHDDRYYTESEINTKLNSKSNTDHTHNLSTMINTLSEGTSTPNDNDYYVSQYAGGGTTTTTYHRRPMKALFEYIKGKLSTVAVSGSYNDLTNKPTIPSVGNGTVTIKQGGTSKGTFTMNQSGNTTIELTDNNSWRGIQNNLTSTSTSDSLSAAQGKWLNENKVLMKTLGGSEDLDSITTVGIYSQGGSNSIKNKPSGVDAFGLIVTHNATGSFYTQLLFSNSGKSYRRFCNSGTWGGWSEDILTDTVYTHPSYTANSNGLYKVTVDSTGHVSGTTAVSKADITALGIPSTNTTYSTGTASTLGLTKLYTGTGTATDGTMTQAAIKSALDGKSATSHTHDDRYYTESEMNSKLDAKLNKTGGVITDGTVAIDNVGLPTFNGSRVNASNVAIGKNGIAIGGVDTSSDGAVIFMESSASESNKLIFALGDDAAQNGANDYIAFRYYNTSGAVTYESKIPSKSGTIALTSDIPTSMAWSNITGKPSTYAPSSHTHNYAGSSSAGGAANSANVLNNVFTGRQTSGDIDFTNSSYANKVTYTVATSSMTTGKPPTDGHLLSFGWDTTAGWGAQLNIGDGSGTHMYIRGADSKDSKSVYGDWKTILDSTNYNSYTPSKTGAGASGSWGINVTGSAAKLSSSAGSATQPVYFSDGKPVACTYTLNASVPSGAKFTDTNTWRGIQNNLTSTSTTDSLSAAQGKVLNDKFASYVPTSRTVNGKALTGNITLSASDVGASASGHNHDSVYLKLSGGTVTGATSFTSTTASTSKSTGAVKISGGLGVAGRMSANEVSIGDGCVITYNSTNKCIDFSFA